MKQIFRKFTHIIAMTFEIIEYSFIFCLKKYYENGYFKNTDIIITVL